MKDDCWDIEAGFSRYIDGISCNIRLQLALWYFQYSLFATGNGP